MRLSMMGTKIKIRIGLTVWWRQKKRITLDVGNLFVLVGS